MKLHPSWKNNDIEGKKNQKTPPQNNNNKQKENPKNQNQTQVSFCHVPIRSLHLRPEVIIILCKTPKKLQLELCVQFWVAHG